MKPRIPSSNTSANENNLGLFLDEFRKRLVVIELISVFLGSLLISLIRFGGDFSQLFLGFPGIPKIIFLPVLWYYNSYKNNIWERALILASSDFYSKILKVGFYTFIYFSAISFIFKYPISRSWVYLNCLGITLLILLIRFIFRFAIRRRMRDISKVTYLYIGKRELKQEHFDRVSNLIEFDIALTYLTAPKIEMFESWLKKYKKVIDQKSPYGVIIGPGEIPSTLLLRRLSDIRRETICDFILVAQIGGLSSRFERTPDINLIRVRQSTVIASGAVLKRMFDVVLSSLGILVLWPLMFIISVAIKLTSKGSIFYIEKRIGQNGKVFDFPKFRSMYQNAAEMRLSVLGRPDEDMVNRYRNDPRITPFGKFIRRWSLDELPQLWTVLSGKMSMVGPRPILQEELSQVKNEAELRFIVKPGLTGIWQVNGRKKLSWEERMKRDLQYLDTWNLWTDLVLLGKTFGTIIKGEGAF